jgi:hypothetical protein
MTHRYRYRIVSLGEGVALAERQNEVLGATKALNKDWTTLFTEVPKNGVLGSSTNSDVAKKARLRLPPSKEGATH